MSTMPGAKGFCTRTPHLEGEEVLLSLKRKLDLPPGSEFDSHKPDKISISRPRVQTRSTKSNSDPLAQSSIHLPDSPTDSKNPAVPQQSNNPTPSVAL